MGQAIFSGSIRTPQVDKQPSLLLFGKWNSGGRLKVLRFFAEQRSGITVSKIRMSALISAILIGCLPGCFPNEGPSTYEPPRVKVQTRDYPGITKEQVLKASEMIFQLADGSDMNITRGSSVLEVKRSHDSLVYKSSWERWRGGNSGSGGINFCDGVRRV